MPDKALFFRKLLTQINFHQTGNGLASLGHGWHPAETDGSWTDGRESIVRLPVDPQAFAHEFTIRVTPWIFPPEFVAQSVAFAIEGEVIAHRHIDKPGTYRLFIPAEFTQGRDQISLAVRCTNAVAPVMIHRDGDIRVLGLLVGSIEVHGLVEEVIRTALRTTGTGGAVVPFLHSEGYCPICEAPGRFVSTGAWLRDGFKCLTCNTLPRERALMATIAACYPDWKRLAIHESSPGVGGLSAKLKVEAPFYSESHFYPNAALGQVHPDTGWRNENLEALTFNDETFDLVITQDVFEHLLDPFAATKEIARVLRPNGAHICTVPLVHKGLPSRRRARFENGEIAHILPPEYHGNPIDPNGTLVTFDWGYDIAEYLDNASGLHSTIVYIDDVTRGIRAEAIEVIIMRKYAKNFTL